jgi:AcrR family transcriptional regulator
MTHVYSEADIDADVDPRWLRSRTRLLDAAAELLRAGGIDAVTIDAVTKESKVARTTLWRHVTGVCLPVDGRVLLT